MIFIDEKMSESPAVARRWPDLRRLPVAGSRRYVLER